METKERDEILSALDFLGYQIEKINNYHDISLFFQEPRIIDGWLILVSKIKNIEVCGNPENAKKWEDRTNTNLEYLINRIEILNKYQILYLAYYNQIKKLLEDYDEKQKVAFISSNTIDEISTRNYGRFVKHIGNINDYLRELNVKSLKARSTIFSVLTEVSHVLFSIMNCGLEIVLRNSVENEELRKAYDDDIKEWSKQNGKVMFKKMREELLRNFRTRLTDENKYDLWCQMLRTDEDALKMAMRQELSSCEDEKQEHWGEDMKAQMDKNGKLMRLIYNSCYTDELIDLGKSENLQSLIELLTPDNLSMFYDIILRRTLIQCEMYPELKTQHEEWLKGNRDNQQGENEITGLGHDKRTKLDDIIQILQKGIWKLPATKENIVFLLNTLFGNNVSSLDDEDVFMCKKMWALVEEGRGDRKMIVSANLAGFFADENLLDGTSTDISKDLFGNNNMVNNINDGKKNNRSNAFDEVIPFLTKYTNKIIRQV